MEPSGDLELELQGPGGEPIDLLRTIASHGVAGLPPFFPDEAASRLTVTVTAGRSVRTVVIAPGSAGRARATIAGPAPSPSLAAAVAREVAYVLRFDDDLSDFYAMAADDPDLSWVTRGAGRMIRSQTVFEEVAKTICTTNCTWSSTERMVDALVEHLGRKGPGAPAAGTASRAFPTPAAMAAAGEDFYRDVARAGYRGAYLRSLAAAVADGEVDLGSLVPHHDDPLPDDEVERRLLALPGVGPYAAAHVMMMIGRYSRLILDSWTRPTYAKLVGRKAVADRTIERRFRRYGRYAGLAFWMLLTRGWVHDEGPARTE